MHHLLLGYLPFGLATTFFLLTWNPFPQALVTWRLHFVFLGSFLSNSRKREIPSTSSVSLGGLLLNFPIYSRSQSVLWLVLAWFSWRLVVMVFLCFPPTKLVSSLTCFVVTTMQPSSAQDLISMFSLSPVFLWSVSLSILVSPLCGCCLSKTRQGGPKLTSLSPASLGVEVRALVISCLIGLHLSYGVLCIPPKQLWLVWL